MTVLRRYSALVAALVLVAVATQTLDLGLCCEAPPPAPSQAETEVLFSGIDAAALPAAPSGERSARGQAIPQDCLCHLVFTVPRPARALPVAVVPTSLVAEAPEPLRSALLSPPGHIPIA